MTARRRAEATTLAVAITLAAGATRAESSSVPTGASPDPERLVQGFAAMDRPSGMAEANVGVLTLPRAEVCVNRSAGCKQGDVSFAVEAWQLYRMDRRLAFGAGIVLGLIPTAHPRQDPEMEERDHSRSYMTVEGAMRYYPYVGEAFELWGGVVGGLVVVNDRFQTVDHKDERALLGVRGATIRTEGASFGLGTGFASRLSEHFSLGGTVRVAQWFLPREPATDPLGSEASLTGRNLVVSIGFGLAYRTQL